jgi:hypothetical protein
LIAKGLAAALTLIIAGGAVLAGCQRFGQPDDVPGERLALEEVASLQMPEGDYGHDIWVGTAATDTDLAALWRLHEGSELPDSYYGELPTVPDGKTAVLFYAGHVDQRTSRRLEGVFNDNGNWVVVIRTVYDDDDSGGDRADFVVFPIPLLFVDAEPPQNIRIKVESSSGGEVEWA